MQTRTVEQIEGWDSRPFSGGYAGLHEMADAQFSGAVTVGRTWLFMLNGRVIGVFEGDLSAFKERNGTVYAAPDPALPLLFAMVELGGETQARYYTKDTPLAEADETLSDAGFTGYIELSENVLSGDYYTVYYGGRSMSAAFIGAAERLLTGDEAFERANDEVGIYEVTNVDLEVIDLPELESEPEPEPVAVADPEPEPERETAPEPTPEPEQTEPESAPEPAETAGPTKPASPTEPSEPEPTKPSSTTVESPPEPESAHATEVASDDSDGDDVFSEEEQWRETKSIPSLDPDRTQGTAEERTRRERRERTNARRPKHPGEAESAESGQAGRQRAAQRQRQSSASTSSTGGDQPSAKARERIAKLRAALKESKQEIERLREEIAELRAANEGDDEERAVLERKVERLKSQLAKAREGAGPAASADVQLSPEEALDGTNLFVRYGSKGKATLEDAHSGRVDHDEVNANLKLEHHTQFDAGNASVEGRPFEEYLRATIEYQFVEWAVESLLYEIRDTGHKGGMRDVYDAIPKIDRAELGGTVTVTTTEEEQQVEREQAFDVILRDRMGNPLLVANVNDSRDPATGDVMASLVEAANGVEASHEELGGAFYVTASFFEPAALETASEATSGGLLSREKRESYVKRARKRGYHLCLVETRAGEFHVNVPEL